MGLSRWRLTWRADFNRVVISMSKREYSYGSFQMAPYLA